MVTSIQSVCVLVAAFACSAICSAAEPATGLAQALDHVLNRASAERIRAGLRANLEYRKAVVATFKFADRVEIFLLDSSTPLAEEEIGFPIRPYKTEARIVRKREAHPSQVKDWCAVIAKAITSPDDGASVFCHFPIYGIRIRAGDQLLFETSVCWKCMNYYFEYDHVPQWEGFSLDAADLKEALEEFIPPESSATKR